jgi:hypothetical protein
MGKKYDDYADAAEAEAQSRTRLEAESIGGDQAAVQQASDDYKQNNLIARELWDEFKEDPQG